MNHFRTVLLGCLIAACAGAATSAHAESGESGFSATPALFNTSEIRSTGLSSFTNWTGMLARFHQSERLGAGLCATAGAGGRSCQWDEWQALIVRLKDKPPMDQLREVNRVMNRHAYVLDRVNWGVEDYWAVVFEFMRKNGDCEDYAIAKYVTLRALGWPVDRLRIVILRDTELDLNHAVLAAYTDEGIYIGDNQVSSLVKADRIHHYRPIYSINETAWWLHRPAVNPAASRQASLSDGDGF